MKIVKMHQCCEVSENEDLISSEICCVLVSSKGMKVFYMHQIIAIESRYSKVQNYSIMILILI